MHDEFRRSKTLQLDPGALIQNDFPLDRDRKSAASADRDVFQSFQLEIAFHRTGNINFRSGVFQFFEYTISGSECIPDGSSVRRIIAVLFPVEKSSGAECHAAFCDILRRAALDPIVEIDRISKNSLCIQVFFIRHQQICFFQDIVKRSISERHTV